MTRDHSQRHPFNAARAEQLGAARVITDPGDAGAAAQEVLSDPAFREAAREVQAQNQNLPSKPGLRNRQKPNRRSGHAGEFYASGGS